MLQPSRLSLVVSAALIGLLLWTWNQSPAPASSGEPGWLLIQSADVFDGQSPGLLHDQDILVHDGSIVSLSPAGQAPLPPGEKFQSLNAKGLCLMPSLTDLGVLLSLQGGFAQDKVPGLFERAGRLLLASGVGSAWDLNSSVAQAGLPQSLDLPQLKFAGPVLMSLEGWRPGPRGDGESPVLEISSPAELPHAFHILRAAKAQLVFLSMENPALQNPPWSAESLRALGDLAHAAGLPVVAQASHLQHALRAMEARPSLLIGPLCFEALGPDLLSAMKKNSCAYAPALSSLLALWPWPNGLARLEALSEALILSPEQRSSLSDPPQLGLWRDALNQSGASGNLALANVRAAHQAGLPLALASLSGLPGCPQGLATRGEIALLLQAGLSLPEIMRIATSGSAKLGGFSISGLVKPGFEADLMLVKGDPLKDAAAHQRVRFIIQQGKVWTPHELRKL
jgi:imidazolonepropionase-like amidohydrolase